jgi:hypothetical protein
VKNLVFLFFTALLFFGCSGKKPPIWLTDSQSYMEKMKLSILTSNNKESQIYKQKAAASIKQSANIEYLQILELTEAASRIAVLQEADFAAFDRVLAIEPNIVNKSYKAMLSNNLRDEEIDNLPANYKIFAKWLVQKNNEKAFEAAQKIEDDISKLVALGILAKIDTNNAAIYEEMLTVSKPNGYKNTTIAATARLATIYAKNGDKQKAERAASILDELKR